MTARPETPEQTEFDLQPGDVVACFGRDAAARVISWATAWPLAPGGLRIGPSHVALICDDPAGRGDGPLWVESTTLCEHACLVRRRPVAGVQAHPPAVRVRDYAGGRVDVYRFHGLAKLAREERTLLARLVHHLLTEQGEYDLGGAIISGTRLLRLLPGAELQTLFCSELVAAVLMRLGRMNQANPARFHPARLLRELVRTGHVTRVASLRG